MTGDDRQANHSEMIAVYVSMIVAGLSVLYIVCGLVLGWTL